MIGALTYGGDSRSPYFHYKDKESSVIHQVFFDDPQSLKWKYNYVLDRLELQGLAYWNIDCTKSQKMWDAIPLL